MEQITDVKTTEMNLMPSAGSKRYWWKAITAFLDGLGGIFIYVFCQSFRYTT